MVLTITKERKEEKYCGRTFQEWLSSRNQPLPRGFVSWEGAKRHWRLGSDLHTALRAFFARARFER